MKKNIQILFIVLFIGAIFRLMHMIPPVIWVDEAAVGALGIDILKGKFPLYLYGTDKGSFEGYLLAPLFYIFGISSFTLKLLPFLISLIFLYSLFLLGKKYFSEEIGLLSCLIIMIPPYFLGWWSVEARVHHSIMPLFGNIILIILHKLLYDPLNNRAIIKLLLISSLIMFIMSWISLLSIYYLITFFFFILLKYRDFLIKNIKNTGLLIISISIALIIFDKMLIYFRTFSDIKSIPVHLKNLFTTSLPIVLLGIPHPVWIGQLERYIMMLLGMIYIIFLLWILYTRRKAILGILKFSLKEANSTEILIVLFVIIVTINIVSVFGRNLEDYDQKYLLSIYSTIPTLFAFFLLNLEKKRIYCFYGLFFIIVAFNTFENFKMLHIFDGQRIFSYKNEEAKKDELISFLKSQKIKGAYADYWIGEPLLIKSQGSITFADLYQETNLIRALKVDSLKNPAFIFSKKSEEFERTLRSIGANYSEKALRNYVVYYNFQDDGLDYEGISPSLWTVNSNYNGQDAKYAIDRDFSTRWTTNLAQKKDMIFSVDLGDIYDIGKIILLPGNLLDLPRGYIIETSLDNLNWKKVAELSKYTGCLFWSGSHPFFKQRNGWFEARFDPINAKYIKIIQIGEDKKYYWSIVELFIYKIKGNKKLEGLNISKLIDFIKSNMIKKVYSEPWLSSNISYYSHGQIYSPSTNLYEAAHRGSKRDPSIPEKIVISPDVAIIVNKEDINNFEEFMVRKTGFNFKRLEINNHIIYLPEKSMDEAMEVKPSNEWKSISNVNPGETQKGYDGNLSTRWSSNSAQKSGMFYMLDLGKVYNINKIILDSSPAPYDNPDNFKLEISSDNIVWQPVKANFSGEVVWMGKYLLRNTQGLLPLSFDSVNGRYIKITLTGEKQNYYWSIYEIKVYVTK